MPLKDPEARRLYKQAWYQVNRERLSVRQRDRRKLNPEAHRVSSLAYYHRHKERLNRSELKRRNDRLYRQRHLEAIREYDRKRSRAPERLRSNRNRYHADPVVRARINQQTREYQRRHPEKKRAWERTYYRKFPSKSTHKSKRRREKIAKASGSHTLAQWMGRVEYYGWKCAYCGEILNTQSLTKDHRIPLSRGGSAWAANLLPSCRSCNSKKRDKTEAEFKERACTAG